MELIFSHILWRYKSFKKSEKPFVDISHDFYIFIDYAVTYRVNSFFFRVYRILTITFGHSQTRLVIELEIARCDIKIALLLVFAYWEIRTDVFSELYRKSQRVFFQNR